MCISLKGFSRERFLNLLAANDIYAWNIKYRGAKIQLCLTLKGLRKIRPLLKKTNCRFRILSRHGLPFSAHKYRRRIVFFTGAAVSFLIIFTLSQFIWLIEINGNFVLSDTEILRFCGQRGIHTGSLKHGIDTAKLKAELVSSYPQISWASVSKNGTRLLIELSENVKNTEVLDYSVPCDIISIRDCVVTDMAVQNGTPAVKPGDAVKKGDILVSAQFSLLDENGLPAALAPAHSIGKIRGKWQEDFEVFIPYKHTEKEYTGKKETFYGAQIFGYKFNTNFIKNDTKFKKYDKINSKKQLGFSPDFPLPFVFAKAVLYEYIEKEAVYTPEEAQAQAEKAINAKILNDYSGSCDITDRKTEFTQSEDGLAAKTFLTIEDDIGAEAEYIQSIPMENEKLK